MAKCQICGKHRETGNNVSHAQNKTKRTFEANIQSTVVYENGRVRKVKACTRCIRTMAKAR